MTHISNVLVSIARFCNPHFSAILEIPPEIPGWKQIILSKTAKNEKSKKNKIKINKKFGIFVRKGGKMVVLHNFI